MTDLNNYIGKSGEQASFEAVVRINDNTINSSITIDANSNGLSAGTITVASGVTVTISSGGNWVIV